MKGANMTNRNKILGSVSAVALAMGLGVSGANALNTSPTVTVNLAGPTVTVLDSSVSFGSAQVNLGEVFAMPNISIIGNPNVANTANNAGDLGGNNINVPNNTIFAIARGNDSDAAANKSGDPLTKANVDLFVAGGGTVSDSAATSAVVQLNNGGASLAGIASVADNVEIRLDQEDLGPASAASLTGNTITSEAAGNYAEVSVKGQINANFKNDELGQATLEQDLTPVTAGASILVSTTQYNVDLAGPEDLSDAKYGQTINNPTSMVNDARIGARVRDTDGDSLAGIPINVANNTIKSDMSSNTSNNDIAVNKGGHTQLSGSAGIVNAQGDESDGGSFTLTSIIKNSVIEAGQADGLAGDATIDDLSAGASVTFTGNKIAATGASNAADNDIVIQSGINVVGPSGAIDQLNTVDGGANKAQIAGDLFIASGQFATYNDNGVDVSVDNGDLNVLVDDVSSSSVTAGDVTLDKNGAILTDTGNSIGATASANTASNTILYGTESQKTASVSAITGINNTQDVAGVEGTIAATTKGELTVDIANTARATGDAVLNTGSVTSSAITIEGNDLFAQATGNAQDSTISIDAGVVDGAGVLPTTTTTSADEATGIASVKADFSVLNGQKFENGSAQALVEAGIDVDVASGTGATALTNSSVSTSYNTISGLAAGNLSSGAGIDIDATSFTGTAGVLNGQVVSSGDGEISSTVTPDTGVGVFIDVNTTAATISSASVRTDSNAVTSGAYGNLGRNDISISGTTVSDGGVALPLATIDRDAADTGNEGTSAVSGSLAGFSILNDQMVADQELGITALLTGDIIEVTVGSATSAITGATVTANGNLGAVRAAANQATSTILADQSDPTEALNASLGIVNTQTVTDLGGPFGSTGIDVQLGNALTGGSDITVDVIGAGALTSLNAQTNNNELSATGRVNQATNVITVNAIQQTITGVIVDGGGLAERSAALGSDTLARGEVSIANDQFFQRLVNGGLDVSNNESDITVDISANGGTLSGAVDADGNLITARAEGNSAANGIGLNVVTFDLTDGSSAGDPISGPIATIASNQRGLNAGEDGIQATTDDATVSVDITATALASANGVQVSTDTNTISAVAQSNVVGNELAVKATDLVGMNPSNASPSVSQFAGPYTELTTAESTFAVASRQENAFDVASSVDGSDIILTAEANGVALALNNSTLSNSGNTVLGLARGNSSSNSAKVDVLNNDAIVHVANLQATSGAAFIEADTTATTIVINADDDSEFSTDLNSTSVNVNGNTVAAIAAANNTTNTATLLGTNIVGGGTPLNRSTSVDLDLPTQATSNADAVVLNSQGGESIASPELDFVSANIAQTIIAADLDQVNSGAVSVSTNTVLADANIHNAINQLIYDAGNNVGTASEANSGAVLSKQVVTAGSTVGAAVDATTIGTQIDSVIDLVTKGSASATVNNNVVEASAGGGTAQNVIDVQAKTSITSDGFGPFPPSVEVDGDVFLSAGYSLVNFQTGDFIAFSGINDDESTALNETEAAIVRNTAIAVSILEDSALQADAVQVNQNDVLASIHGFSAINVISLVTGDKNGPGAAITAVSHLANQQNVQGTGAEFEANVLGTVVTANIEGDITGGSVSVSKNDVTASSSGATATNAIYAESGAGILQGATSVSVSGSTVVPAVGVTTFSDTAILNNQSGVSFNGTSIVEGVEISADFDTDSTDQADVTEAGVTVDLNTVQARTRGLAGTNTLSLVTDGQVLSDAAIVSRQDYTSTIPTNLNATVTLVEIISEIDGDLSGSGVSVSGNRAISTAVIGEVDNALTVDAGAGILSMTTAGNQAPNVINGITGVVSTGSDYNVINGQYVNGGQGVIATKAETTNVNVGVAVETPGGGVEVQIADTGIAVNGNVVGSEARGLDAVNQIDLTAGAGIEATAQIASLQRFTGINTLTANTANVAVGIQANDSVSSSGLTVSTNYVIANAIGGVATNALSVSSLGSLDNIFTAPLDSESNLAVTQVATLRSDYSVSNVQLGALGTTSTLTNVGIGIQTGIGGEDVDVSQSGLTVRGNTASSTSRGFVALNSIEIESGSSSDVTGHVSNMQALGGNISATASNVLIGTNVGIPDTDGGVSGTAVTVDGNRIEAVASGNYALNSVDVSAAAALQETAGVDMTIGFAGGLDVNGADFAVLNAQSNAAIVSATVTDSDIQSTGMGGVTGVLNSAVSVQGNTVVAEAVGNDAINTISMDGGNFNRPAAGIANSQLNSGAGVSAVVSGVNIGVGAGINNAGNSSQTVGGNSIGAIAIGNRASSSIGE